MRAIHVLLPVLALGALAVGIGLWLHDPGPGTRAGVERGSPPAPGRAQAADLPDSPAIAPRSPSEGEARTAATGREAVAAAGRAAETGLGGRVLDAEGRPVAGARVFAGPYQAITALPLDLMGPSPGAGTRRQEVLSDPDGRFLLEPIGGPALQVAVRAAGFAPLRAELAHPGPGGDLGELVLERGVVLEGRVVDPRGLPVAGVELHLLPPRQRGAFVMAFGGEGTRVGETDERGAFRMDQAAAGPYALRFEHPDHPDRLLEGVADRPGEHVRDLLVQLEAGVAVSGWVRGLGGRDPGELRVRARERLTARPGFDFSRFPRPRLAEIGPEGEFSVGGLHAERDVELAVVAAGSGPFGGERSGTVVAQAGRSGVELALHAESALILRVVDAATRAPIEQVSVEAGTRWRAEMRDAEGQRLRHHPGGVVRFAPLEVFPGDHVSVRVSAEGYRSFEREGISMEPGQELDLGLVALEPVPMLEVRVVSAASGEPIAGAHVRLAEQREPESLGDQWLLGYAGAGISLSSEGESRTARTDGDGVARVTSLPGRTATLTVRHPDYVEHQGTPFRVPEASPDPLEVALSSGGRVIVRVIDSAGRPVEGVAIQHRPPPRAHGATETLPRQRHSSRDGSVTFAHLEEGLHGFRVDAAGEGMIFGTPARVLGPGRARADAGPPWSEVAVREGAREELVLRAPQRGGLSGRITEGGRALAGATLALHREEGADPRARALRALGGTLQARTGSDGRYAFEPVGTGGYVLAITHPARAMPFEAPVVIEEGGVELSLDLPQTSIAGRVLDGDGRPVEGASVRIEQLASGGAAAGSSRTLSVSMRVFGGGGGGNVFSVGGGDAGVRTDSRGRYELRGVPADVELVVRAEGQGNWQPARSPALNLRPDQALTGIDLELLPGGSLSVSVVDPGGAPVTQCLLTVDFVGGADPRPEGKREFVHEEGPVRIQGLTPGPWRVRARQFGGPGASQRESEAVEVEVRAGREHPLEVRMP